eukprot:CAMPEP_0114619836 /NCGR_PEP_ID=MMETSP0168-20121206/8413_1 /TAXON_ID=95228 ORGANISM="Vannella sp., Strain DIVA3 517/6/12" /NCGR_SAMPLE_ID=MMETSP0168 /ASSEMBLY_ACC=CAM_ASM_000044 /LENGTH=394 /DNA_ID=CAMNT_0001831005 /DNA_START=1 /DNA_END=1182 /DNA_ORIENTATION=-
MRAARAGRLARAALPVCVRAQSTLPPGVAVTTAPATTSGSGSNWTFLPLATVPTNERWVTEKGGAYHRTLGPGTSFLTPFSERVVFKGPADPQLVDVGRVGVFCSDGGHAMAEAAVAYRLEDMRTAYYSAADHKRFVRLTARSLIASAFAQRSVRDVLKDRLEVADALTEDLRRGLAQLGIAVQAVLVTDVQPEPVMAAALQAACTDKLTEEQHLEFSKRRHEEKLRQLEQERALNEAQWKEDLARLRLQHAVDKTLVTDFLVHSKGLIEDMAPHLREEGAADAAALVARAFGAVTRRQGLTRAADTVAYDHGAPAAAPGPAAAEEGPAEAEEESAEEGAGLGLEDLEAFEQEHEDRTEASQQEAAEEEAAEEAADQPHGPEMTRAEAERADLE